MWNLLVFRLINVFHMPHAVVYVGLFSTPTEHGAHTDCFNKAQSIWIVHPSFFLVEIISFPGHVTLCVWPSLMFMHPSIETQTNQWKTILCVVVFLSIICIYIVHLLISGWRAAKANWSSSIHRMQLKDTAGMFLFFFFYIFS